MNWNWQLIFDSIPAFLKASVLTVELILLSGFLGLLLALPIALGRMSKNPWVRAVPFAYIFFFRGSPLLVQLFLIYNGLDQFEFIKNSGWLWEKVLSNAFWCAIIAFTLNTAAYIAEIIRGSISSIPKGELEAADAIGMSYGQKLRRIVLPRAFGIMIPAYSNEVIFMLKGSALAYSVTLVELTAQAKNLIAKNYSPLEMYFTAGVFYLVLSWVFVAIFRVLEKRFNRHLNYKPLRPTKVVG